MTDSSEENELGQRIAKVVSDLEAGIKSEPDAASSRLNFARQNCPRQRRATEMRRASNHKRKGELR